MNFVLPIVLGAMFGFSLNKAGLTKYHRIANQFRFKDMMVMKFIMTALATAMIGAFVLRGLGVLTFPSVPATYIVGNVLGGLIFGIGMSLVGYWPGTCVAGSGEGKLDYLVPGLLGFLAGAFLFGLTYEQVFPAVSKIANYGQVTIPELWNIDPYLTAIVFALMGVLLFYAIDRMGLQRKGD